MKMIYKLVVVVFFFIWGGKCLAQSSYQHLFLLPAEIADLPVDGSGIDWVYSDVTNSCSVTKAEAANGYTDNRLILLSAGEFMSTKGCKDAAVNDIISFTVTVTDPTHAYFGKTLSWTGSILPGASSEDVYLEFEKVNLNVSAEQTVLYRSEIEKTLKATFVDAPADIVIGKNTVDGGIAGTSISEAIEPVVLTGTELVKSGMVKWELIVGGTIEGLMTSEKLSDFPGLIGGTYIKETKIERVIAGEVNNDNNRFCRFW